MFLPKLKGGKENMAKLLIEMSASIDGELTLWLELISWKDMINSTLIIFKRLYSKVGTVGDETFPNVERVPMGAKQLLTEAR